MNPQEQLQALATYFELMALNGGARVYRTAMDTGIFQSLAAGAATAAEVASACDLDERPVALVLETLRGMGTVVRDEGRYALAPVMGLLLFGPYRNLSDEYWDQLPAFLKTGEPMARMDAVDESEEQYQKQAKALAWMMRPAAEAVARMLEMGTRRKGARILDVGCGAAVWSLALAAHEPEAHVTGADWPQVVEIAAASAQAQGMAERFTPLAGNIHEMVFEDQAYDLVIVANVTHILTSEQNFALFAKLNGALRSGGELLVVDVLPGQEQGELSRALYALGLGLRTGQGRVYEPVELTELLSRAGLEVVQCRPIPVTPHTMGVIVAKAAG